MTSKKSPSASFQELPLVMVSVLLRGGPDELNSEVECAREVGTSSQVELGIVERTGSRKIYE